MGQVEKARQGQFSAPAPFGFTKEGESLVKNPEEGEVLLDMIDKMDRSYVPLIPSSRNSIRFVKIIC